MKETNNIGNKLDKIIAILFLVLNFNIILTGIASNSEIALGFPYWQVSGRYLLAFDRAPIASRLTMVLIFLIIINGAITYLLTRSKGD